MGSGGGGVDVEQGAIRLMMDRVKHDFLICGNP